MKKCRKFILLIFLHIFRHELGQGEGDHLDKKLHGQTGDEKCSDMQGGLDASAVTMVYDMKLRSSVATSAVASTSCTNIPVDGGKEVQSGDMISFFG